MTPPAAPTPRSKAAADALPVAAVLAGNDLRLTVEPAALPALRAMLEGAGVRCVADRAPGTLRAAAGSYTTLLRLPVALTCAFDTAPRLSFVPAPTLTPRSYQQEALDAWIAAGRRGVVELPTGSGKTFVAVLAMATVGVRTLVIVPTIDLLAQWRRAISSLLPTPAEAVGVLGGGERRPSEITVATYQSAMIHGKELLNYGLLVFDEVHHLPADSFRRIAEVAWAPARLGLTATSERSDGRHTDLDDLLGPVVYRRSPADLKDSGGLARYREVRRYVEFSDDEAAAYRQATRVVRDYLRTAPMRPGQRGASSYELLIQRAAGDPAAREALQAYQQARRLAWNAAAKVGAIEEILRRHAADTVILFSESNEMVERLARRFLLPAVTHETPAEERRWILDALRSGQITKVATGRVFNEGVDLPAATVGVISSGNSTRLEYVQRLGRLLRPKGDGSQAVLYEILTRGTAEPGQSARRRGGALESAEDAPHPATSAPPRGTPAKAPS
ncbi:MAG: DEAD/DEAH box helicase [Chloroflexi bacterium]|nr:DEAD/DEAH box helicase [Chloroflexota bacterium]